MKGLIVGDWEHAIYEEAIFNGFKENGVHVYKFCTSDFIDNSTFSRRLKNRLSVSKEIYELNQKFYDFVTTINPDFIFFQRVNEILISTVKKINRFNKNIILLNFHNDNPFIQKNKYYFYRNFFKLIKLSDINYAYRPSNITDYYKFGAKSAKLLPPYFVKTIDDKKDGKVIFKNDVVFIGHFEPDGRDLVCKFLYDNGIDLKIYGNEWDKSLVKDYPNVFPFVLDKTNYIKEIRQSKIVLVFLSTKNNDVYTRRNFEIPASGSFMITPENNEIKKFYKKDVECVMYNSEKELFDLISYYLNNSNKRKAIAEKGCIRCNNEYNNIKITSNIVDDIKIIKAAQNR